MLSSRLYYILIRLYAKVFKFPVSKLGGFAVNCTTDNGIYEEIFYFLIIIYFHSESYVKKYVMFISNVTQLARSDELRFIVCEHSCLDT